MVTELVDAIVEEYSKGKDLKTLLEQAKSTRLESILANKKIQHKRANTVDNLFNAMFKGW